MSIFSTNFTISKDQTEGGRLEHIALLKLLKKARLNFLEKYQMQEDCIVPGIGFVIGELNIRYIGTAQEGDKINIALDINEISEKRCVLLYKVNKEPDGSLVAAGKTAIIFFDIAANKSTKIPEMFLEIARKPEKSEPTLFDKTHFVSKL